ncbi:GDSL-like lipase/acylhydrolase family protein [Salegentibacter sp. 24]|uniref:G-D-S-L family lipolytic protein n=1 Tax=Salegentibacter sp. 24 TaxID=2183986 RepID=UPI00105D1DB5|nr:G-D-S-L family lipolytic protein [Salegentibacter sp. 24]TDN95643.1 GDSL-like lipase/acylhydrolase family protein [Salegentibacter sp. 24]
MKQYFKYLAILALGIVSCEPEFDNPVNEAGAYSNGEADFSRYVALGNSLTAGYADNALYITGQENSYPNILVQQFEKTQDVEEFAIPYMNDNAGGLLLGGTQITSNRLVLAVDASDNPSPQVYTGMQATTEVGNILQGPFNNMGIPGAKSYHLVAPGYGNVQGVAVGTANPYFVRFASSPETTVLADALAQNPTFFSLWIGNNDVLGYATSGGTGEFQLNNLDPSTYGENDITDPNAFAGVYAQMVQALSASASGGVLINIPDVAAVPFFNTIPNNRLELDAETAANLTGYFQAVSQVFAGGLIQQGVPAEQAQALASQYAITFSEGPNRFLIDVEPSDSNPLGFRQMTPDEKLLLTIDRAALAQGYGAVSLSPQVMQILGALQQGQTPTQEEANALFGAVNGIDDADALDEAELANVRQATAAYNDAIEATAVANNLGYVDARELLNQLAEGGIAFDAGIITSEFVTGGAFSLDGIHLTPRGNAVMANEIIEVINTTYNAQVPKVNPGTYGTVTLSNEVE